jgi:hypothetical protein
LASESNPLESSDISTGIVAGVLWACWHEGENVQYLDRLAMKSWNGSSWAGGGLVIPAPPVGTTAGQCAIADVGGTPYVVFRQSDNRFTTPQRVYVVVYQWNGTSFVQVGGNLNRDGIGANGGGNPQTVAGSVAIVSNGTQPCVAWEEHTLTTGLNLVTTSAGQVYASCWNSSSWVAQGGSANIDTANRAAAVSATYLGGALHVAFTERTATALTKLYVRKWTGSAWTTIGTTTCANNCLNRDATNGWVYRSELTNDGTNLFLSFDESGNDQPWISNYSLLPGGYGTIAARPQTFVAKWDGSTWSYLGGSVNADPAYGAAEHPSIAMLSGNPVVASAEVKFGTLRQVYVKQWNGTDWAPPAAGPVANGGSTMRDASVIGTNSVRQ